MILLDCVIFSVDNRSATDEPQVGSKEPTSEPATLPTTEPKLWQKLRLPTNLKPLHYDLFFRIDITNEEFTGSNTMLIECQQPIDIILIHSKQLEIEDNSVTLRRQDGGTAPGVSRFWLYPENQYLVIELDGMLQGGSTMYELTMDFTGALKADLAGLYKSSYKTAGGETK